MEWGIDPKTGGLRKLDEEKLANAMWKDIWNRLWMLYGERFMGKKKFIQQLEKESNQEDLSEFEREKARKMLRKMMNPEEDDKPFVFTGLMARLDSRGRYLKRKADEETTQLVSAAFRASGVPLCLSSDIQRCPPGPSCYASGLVLIGPSVNHLKLNKASCSAVLTLAYQSLGLVYGDLSTSPLYVYKTTFSGKLSLHEDDEEIYADDNGEGGAFAFYSLLCHHAKLSMLPNQQDTDEKLSVYGVEKTAETWQSFAFKSFFEKHTVFRKGLLIFVLLGTCMTIGDGVLTPAISDYVVAISCVLLVGIFSIQHHGTNRVAFFRHSLEELSYQSQAWRANMFADIGHFSTLSMKNSNLVDEMDAFIDPDMFQSDIESFLLNLLDEKWNSNLMVDMDEIIAGLEMDSVPPVDDYLMQESEDKPLENASPTDQVQRLTQRMGQAPFFTD
ncbi:potassium transporter 1 [Artemisia annua]|uniref:Potassium transporter 1 n=1 Tax=Artemisia annua TaxID=35608 RepID=A0A2U1M1G7_ARTAN|nr:potassium transporter 1 [Artemisia annua]